MINPNTDNPHKVDLRASFSSGTKVAFRNNAKAERAASPKRQIPTKPRMERISIK
jgi:hypothetical protein